MEQGSMEQKRMDEIRRFADALENGSIPGVPITVAGRAGLMLTECLAEISRLMGCTKEGGCSIDGKE